MKCKSSSTNVTALKALAESKTVYEFSTENGYTDITGYHDFTHRNEIISGITLIPGNSSDPSPDDKVHIVTNQTISEKAQVNNVAHEGYGHAYLYERQQQGEDVSPNHKYENILIGTRWNEEFQKEIPVFGRKDVNETLILQIEKAVKESSNNFELWKN